MPRQWSPGKMSSTSTSVRARMSPALPVLRCPPRRVRGSARIDYTDFFVRGSVLLVPVRVERRWRMWRAGPQSGIMGHVDSGKTSLARALSTIVSTAGLDKHPQSQERGITLDLGFSSFDVPVPEHIQKAAPGYAKLTFTLVDCPGHASLIRTIIGGAQIIDMMMLVIDVTKAEILKSTHYSVFI